MYCEFNFKLITNEYFDLKVQSYQIIKQTKKSLEKQMTSFMVNNLNQTVIQKAKQKKQIGNFIIGKQLGEGTFGKVRLGTHTLTNQKVAIKILQKKKIIDTSDVQRVNREMHILKLVRHPSLVQLYQIIQTPKQLFIIMEYMENGELFDYIVKNRRIKEDQAIKMFHQIIDGIQYMHELGIAHRDLKPQNILLTYNKSLKIVDFGLGNTYKKGQLLKSSCGSPCYAPPEMIQGQKYQGIKADIWSSGIILFAMLNGYLPFQDQNSNKLYKKVLQGDYTFHSSCSKQGKDLIQKILNNNPNERYSIQQIRNHPWMQRQKGRKIHNGIKVGYNKIPVDKNILQSLVSYPNHDLDYIQKCIEANRHNQVTVTYYLTMKKFVREGGSSLFDLANDNFDRKSIQPNKRKEKSQIMIDNFFTKASCNGSTDLNSNHDRKNRLSKERQQNKQNISYMMNKKKSKDKPQRKSKQKSKDNIKVPLKQRDLNTSTMFGSTNIAKSTKLHQSVEKKSESLIKKIKNGTSSGKIQKKAKSSKLDNSINYGRIPMTKSIQKHSGRESQAHTDSNHRQSIMQNRISRKYKQTFNQSLISKSKGKLKTQTQRQRVRINSSSINQSINQCTGQGFNITTIANVNTYSGQTMINMNKKYKDHDSSTGFIEQYLMKGKKTQQRRTITSNLKSGNDSSKMIKPRKL